MSKYLQNLRRKRIIRFWFWSVSRSQLRQILQAIRSH